MKLWGKELTKEEAIARISELQAEIYSIENSPKYAMYSDAGNDSLWYAIEAKLDEIEMLKDEYGIEEA
jgi:hypothetical protein